ncbi:hypothetical protein [Hydrogenophaga sp.]|nr:hypothetical protein [Hydrogenophaga sp.]
MGDSCAKEHILTPLAAFAPVDPLKTWPANPNESQIAFDGIAFSIRTTTP